jgi:hypothetical protein
MVCMQPITQCQGVFGIAADVEVLHEHPFCKDTNVQESQQSQSAMVWWTVGYATMEWLSEI